LASYGQGAGSTETGVYAISDGLAETRDPNANYFIPSEDEWYKAAYHQPAAAGGDTDDYWLYPTGSNSVPDSDQPSGTLSGRDSDNVANFISNDSLANGFNDGYAVSGSNSFGLNPFTDVGAYTDADSPYGTFDQGGNVFEWNEAVLFGSARGRRGGSWGLIEDDLRSSGRGSGVGFRVASPAAAVVPVPAAAWMGGSLLMCEDSGGANPVIFGSLTLGPPKAGARIF